MSSSNGSLDGTISSEWPECLNQRYIFSVMCMVDLPLGYIIQRIFLAHVTSGPVRSYFGCTSRVNETKINRIKAYTGLDLVYAKCSLNNSLADPARFHAKFLLRNIGYEDASLKLVNQLSCSMKYSAYGNSSLTTISENRTENITWCPIQNLFILQGDEVGNLTFYCMIEQPNDNNRTWTVQWIINNKTVSELNSTADQFPATYSMLPVLQTSRYTVDAPVDEELILCAVRYGSSFSSIIRSEIINWTSSFTPDNNESSSSPAYDKDSDITSPGENAPQTEALHEQRGFHCGTICVAILSTTVGFLLGFTGLVAVMLCKPAKLASVVGQSERRSLESMGTLKTSASAPLESTNKTSNTNKSSEDRSQSTIKISNSAPLLTSLSSATGKKVQFQEDSDNRRASLKTKYSASILDDRTKAKKHRTSREKILGQLRNATNKASSRSSLPRQAKSHRSKVTIYRKIKISNFNVAPARVKLQGSSDAASMIYKFGRKSGSKSPRVPSTGYAGSGSRSHVFQRKTNGMGLGRKKIRAVGLKQARAASTSPSSSQFEGSTGTSRSSRLSPSTLTPSRHAK